LRFGRVFCYPLLPPAFFDGEPKVD
jgi:hypothetical protein